MGTVGYMSPEQVRGERVDAPSDIFSLGCVLYEMLAGRRAFARETAAQTMAAILETQPPELSSLGTAIPSELERVLAHCLEKNPRQRFQSAHDLGFALRNIGGEAQRPHRLPRVVWILATMSLLLAVMLAYWLTQPRQEIDSLAVLPFLNAGGDPNMEYLSDGIAEQLINSLSQLPKLRVAARSLAFRYKGPQVDQQRAGRDLKVRAVLGGRVVARGGEMNIQADLISVEDGSQLWGRQYSRHFSDILSLQKEIAREVAEKLGKRQTAEQQRRQAKRSTEDTEAYQAYLRGRYYWNRRTEQTLKRAAEYFQQAIDKDPGYALAWAGLADCYAIYPAYQVKSPRDSDPKAKAAAVRALEIDDTLAQAHAALGVTKTFYDWDWAGAKREFQQAIELDSTYPFAFSWYGEYLAATGRTDEAVASLKRAQQLDPLSLIIHTGAGNILYWVGRYDESVEQFRNVLEMDPNFSVANWHIGWPYVQQGMYREAILHLQKALDLSGGSPAILGDLGHAYAQSGNRDKAQQVLAELHELGKHPYVAPIEIAGVYAGLRDERRALE